VVTPTNGAPSLNLNKSIVPPSRSTVSCRCNPAPGANGKATSSTCPVSRLRRNSVVTFVPLRSKLSLICCLQSTADPVGSTSALVTAKYFSLLKSVPSRDSSSTLDQLSSTSPGRPPFF